MSTIVERAPAKLNLALHVRARRPDGYHDIETLFVFCRDGDVVTLADAAADSFVITGPFAAALGAPKSDASSDASTGGTPSPFGLSLSKPCPSSSSRAQRSAALRQAQGERVGVGPTPASTTPVTPGSTRSPASSSFAEIAGGQSDNLVIRGLHAFRAAFATTQPHAITLEKNLPVASGIGGGSADAAATLRALARRHAIAGDDPRLRTVAASLGADVPACLHGRPAFGTGRGDALVAVTGWRGTPVLLVNPSVSVSTGAVFAAWDGVDRGRLDPADPLAGRNDLEFPARALAPAIEEAIALLAVQSGAHHARMSGSGATCFALFADEVTRDAAAVAIAEAQPHWWQFATTLA